MSEPRKKKVVVAVHGIGDQIKYSTPQQVLSRFCQYHGAVAAVPLGKFHEPGGMLTLTADYPEPLQDFVFTEVYWAGVPREVVKDGHELEGTKPWVRTLIGRVQRNAMTKEDLSDRDFQMIAQVLKEMLESISVLDRVFYLTGRMGIFSFDLDKVLTDFLGDVQIVAEFKDSSRKILKIFNDQMVAVHRQYPDADIYFVAHSEGTVVTLLGLLHAMCDPIAPDQPAGDYEWLRSVRGLMTIGSPIDKHLTLWPELFRPFSQGPIRHPAEPIEWRNYFDYGDPIGFELDEARKWFVDDPVWKQKHVFHFEPGGDRGFSRYSFPGKAHNDYWQDQAVFGHFLQDVIHKSDPPPAKPKVSAPPLASRWWTPVASRMGPYLFLLAVLFCGVFILHKAADAYTMAPPDSADLFGDVAGVSLLIAGLTVMVRIPRLSRRWYSRLIGVLLFLLSVATFPVLTCDSDSFKACLSSSLQLKPHDLGMIGLALVVAGISWIWSLLRPTHGMRALLIPGLLATAAYLYVYLAAAKPPHGDLWPMFLAGALFVYLWWLVTLLFDLVFVWHRYIRSSEKLKYLRSHTPEPSSSEKVTQPGSPLVPQAPSPGAA